MAKRKVFNWEAIRAEFEKSDLTVENFARMKGFSKTAAHNHLNDIAAKKRQIESEQAETEADPTPEFIPLELCEPNLEDIEVPEVTFIKTPTAEGAGAPAGKPIELRLGDLSFLLPKGFDKETLKDALEVVKASC